MELLGLNTTIKVILLDELENLELAIMFDISLPKCNKKQLILNQNGHNNQGRKSTLYQVIQRNHWYIYVQLDEHYQNIPEVVWIDFGIRSLHMHGCAGCANNNIENLNESVFLTVWKRYTDESLGWKWSTSDFWKRTFWQVLTINFTWVLCQYSK